MTHPEDLLADYVDGTLGERERAVVDAHVATCAVCREEVRLAGAARVSLAALEDRPVPFGVTGPAITEAGRRFERRRVATWDRLRWAAGLAAAAALIVVVAVNVGGEDSREAATRAAGAGTGATAQAPRSSSGGVAERLTFPGLEPQPGVTYDADGIRAVALHASDVVVAAQRAPAPAQEAQAPSPQAAQADSGAAAYEPPGPALRCVAQSGGPAVRARDALIRLIEAEYEGTPAYIAVYAHGPGAGLPPDHIVVWVVGTKDCRILTTASQRIPAP